MILYRGNRTKLQNLSWHVLEISNQALAETLRGLVRMLAKCQDPIEVFLPPGLNAEDFCYVRTPNPQTIYRMKRIKGIQGVVSEERIVLQGNRRNRTDPTIISTPVRVPDSDVQQMIEQARQNHTRQSASIRPGSFVRIRDGQASRYCGHVTRIKQDRATVTVALPTRTLVILTPTANLDCLTGVPKAQQLYYYAALGQVNQSE